MEQKKFRLQEGSMRTKLIVALASITVLAACTQVDPLDARIQANIDPEIQGEERAVIARHMRLLKPQDWEFVTYITDGKVYVNRVQLKGLLEVAQLVGGNVYRLSDGSTFPISNDSVGQPLGYQITNCSSASGPFRRIKTQPGAGSSSISKFAYAYATVSPGGLLLGSDSPPSVTTSSILREVAYAYLGTGANSATGLVESDVGLQWSPQYGNWAPYVKVGSTLATANRNNTRYQWYAETNLAFSVLADGIARITYSGVVSTAQPGASTINPYSVDFDLPGLKLSGVGNVFKRVTSIAQADGSGNPVFNQTSGAEYTLGWSNLRLGLTSSSGLHVWGQAAPDVAEDCVTAKTQVASTGSGSEEVYIRLR